MNENTCFRIDIELALIGLQEKMLEFEMKRAEAVRDGNDSIERVACDCLFRLQGLYEEAEKLMLELTK